jgi:hypothetical protein
VRSLKNARILLILIVMSVAATTAQQSAWPVPRTAWSDPDFEGIWNYATMTPLERPRDRQQHGRARRWDPGTRRLAGGRTSLIVDPADGRLPPMTNDAQKAAAERAQSRRRGPAEGPEDLALKERCLYWESAGPPMMPAPYNDEVQFIQTKNYLVIFNEMIRDARVVPLDGRPHGTTRRWMRDSTST